MDRTRQGAYPARDLPIGCWHKILQFSEPPAIARAGAVNRTSRTAAYDDRLWYPHFKKAWSPDPCGSLQTKWNGKGYGSLYGRWRTGQPAAVELIPGVHKNLRGDRLPAMQEIQVSEAGALAAWSVGGDDALVGTDVTTCQPRNKFWHPQSAKDLNGLTVLDSIGLVCTFGKDVIGWDPRQEGGVHSPTPAFSMKHGTASDDESPIHAMISASSPEGDGPPQVLTGTGYGRVHLWDLRFIDGGPVRHYASKAPWVTCLARERRHGTLLGGGLGGISCWDWETGTRLSTLCTGEPTINPWTEQVEGLVIVNSLVAGRDRLVAGNGYYPGTIIEWAVADPQAIVEGPEPQRIRMLMDADNNHVVSRTMQGLGEGPDRLLAGTCAGSICMWDCREDPEQLPICWSLGDHACPGVPVSCLAATDQVVVNGFVDGALRIMRVDSPFVQHGN